MNIDTLRQNLPNLCNTYLERGKKSWISVLDLRKHFPESWRSPKLKMRVKSYAIQKFRPTNNNDRECPGAKPLSGLHAFNTVHLAVFHIHLDDGGAPPIISGWFLVWRPSSLVPVMDRSDYAPDNMGVSHLKIPDEPEYFVSRPNNHNQQKQKQQQILKIFGLGAILMGPCGGQVRLCAWQ